MSILTIILIGVGLAMDCFAVSTTQGLSEGRWTAKAILMAVLFGLFQGGMPLIGYAAGTLFADFFSKYAPWIALLLLLFIGGKMIFEEPEAENEGKADWKWTTIVMLAIATSIDALATGVIFIPCSEQLVMGIAIIAICSLLFSIAGFLMGVFVGSRFRLNTNLIGGLILIGIGIKIWVEGCLL